LRSLLFTENKHDRIETLTQRTEKSQLLGSLTYFTGVSGHQTFPYTFLAAAGVWKLQNPVLESRLLFRVDVRIERGIIILQRFCQINSFTVDYFEIIYNIH